ncbi:MAG: peptidoglycan-binding protein [Alphaproteobacteria bacterium]|nr:peptidoglycan-binding protein [Alphaproteobacteria bacterium]
MAISGVGSSNDRTSIDRSRNEPAETKVAETKVAEVKPADDVAEVAPVDSTPAAPRDVALDREVAAAGRLVGEQQMRARLDGQLAGVEAAAPAAKVNPTRRSFTVGDPAPVTPVAADASVAAPADPAAVAPADPAAAAPADIVTQDRDWSTASREDLEGLQTELKSRGFNPGPVDGVWGPRTSGALDQARVSATTDFIGQDRDWSAASRTDLKGLQRQLEASGNSPGPVDGVWGPNTSGALDAARAARAETATPPADAGAAPVDPAAAPVDPAAAPTDVDEERPPDLDKLPTDIIYSSEDWSQASPERVRELQTTLTEAGIDAGPINGQWGKATEDGLTYARYAIEHEMNRGIYEANDARMPEVPETPVVVVGGGLDTPPEGAPPRVVPETRRADLLGRSAEEWAKAPGAEVEELQTFLKERGYQTGEVDGRWGRTTQGALELAQRRERLLNGYSGADSFVSDIARGLSPLPSNMDNLILSKLGMDTAITDESLSPEERLTVYDTALAAMDRSGQPVGGTTYDDYGRPEFNEYFNRGNMTRDAVMSSFDDPQFRMASTLGRFTYMQDPENPDRVFVFDGYDWNTSERDFDTESAPSEDARTYREVRNAMREGERTDGPSERDNRAFLVFSRAEMEALRAQLAAGN